MTSRDHIGKAYLEASNKCRLLQAMMMDDDDVPLDLNKMVAEYAEEMDTLRFEELVMPLMFGFHRNVVLAYRNVLTNYNYQTQQWVAHVIEMATKHFRAQGWHGEGGDVFDWMMIPEELSSNDRAKNRILFCMRPQCIYLCRCGRPLVWLWHPIHKRYMLHPYPSITT